MSAEVTNIQCGKMNATEACYAAMAGREFVELSHFPDDLGNGGLERRFLAIDARIDYLLSTRAKSLEGAAYQVLALIRQYRLDPKEISEIFAKDRYEQTLVGLSSVLDVLVRELNMPALMGVDGGFVHEYVNSVPLNAAA